MKQNHLIVLYFLLLICEIVGDYIFDNQGSAYGIWLFKPLLMPVLMLWYYRETKMVTGFDKLIMVSLFFSWWGDNFLMPGIFKTDINFLFGLASFLVAHILYTIAFHKTNTGGNSALKRKPYLIFIFLGIGIALIYSLFKANVPGFKDMSIPVIVYASVIMVMVLSAINRQGRVPIRSFELVLIGALLFMVSDSTIALNKFTYTFRDHPFLASLIIMSLYGIGQYLIAKGSSLQIVQISNSSPPNVRDDS